MGSQQPHNFLEKNFVLTMHRDMTADGYQEVLEDVNVGRFAFSDKSFINNAQRIRNVLAEWAQEKLQPGEPRAWKRAARDVVRPGQLSEVSLWMDSVDFPKQYHKGWSRKDPDYSYKLWRLGRRYMFVQDAQSQILRIWGGYSPKLYDGHFVELMHQQIERDFDSADIIADQHFEYGNQFLRHAYIWTNPAEPNPNKRKREGEDLENPTKEIKAYKRAHQRLRARVEDVFGLMTQKFHSLAVPWRESEEQMDNLVFIAAAVHNSNL